MPDDDIDDFEVAALIVAGGPLDAEGVFDDLSEQLIPDEAGDTLLYCDADPVMQVPDDLEALCVFPDERGGEPTTELLKALGAEQIIEQTLGTAIGTDVRRVVALLLPGRGGYLLCRDRFFDPERFKTDGPDETCSIWPDEAED